MSVYEKISRSRVDFGDSRPNNDMPTIVGLQLMSTCVRGALKCLHSLTIGYYSIFY